MPLLLQDAAERVKDLGAGPNCVGKRLGADRHHHELLEVDAAVGVGAAIEDVHHRHWQRHRLAAIKRREVLVERHAGSGGGRARQRHRDPEQRVGPEPTLGRRAVERDHRLIDRALIALTAFQSRRDLPVDVRHRLGDPLAEVTRFVAVAKLERFAFARRRARRHGRAADDAGIERDFRFDGGITARVDDLAPFDLCDGVHA